jgi:hypothetical protein
VLNEQVSLKKVTDLKPKDLKNTEAKADKSKKNKLEMKKTISWISGLFKDEKGNPSSKRFVGIMCALSLCVTMYHNQFTTADVAPAQYLVDAVALLAFGCLGLSSVDKFTQTKKQISEATKNED